MLRRYQMPDRDEAGEDKGGEKRGLQHGQSLRQQQQAPPVPAVGEDAGEGGEEKSGDLSGETDHAEQHRRAGEAVDEPADGHLLHPGADQRNALAGEKKTKVAGIECPQ